MDFKLDVYSHYVKVTGFNKFGKDALLEFCRPLAQYGVERVGFNQYRRKMLRIFAAATRDRSEFRFHVNQLEDLLDHLKRYVKSEESISLKHHRPHDPVKVKFKMKKHFVDHDYQIPIIDYLSNTQFVNVLTLQTGKGKTHCALRAAEKLGVRTMLVLKGGYVKQWINSYKDAMEGPVKDLMVVRGAKHLKTLLELGVHGQLTAKFIIITSGTMYNYIQEYEAASGGDIDYPIPPDQMMETLGIGLRIVDEVHQLFHFNYRLDLYTNVSKTICLSATLNSDDPFKNRVYRIAFPPSVRFQGAEYDKYIAVKALTYTLTEPKLLRWVARGRQNYSHGEFEKSLIKHKHLLDRYVNLIGWIIREEFINSRKGDQKMLVFSASKQLCTILTERFTKIYPNLKVSRYIDEDDFTVLKENDLIFSTLLSSGTAVDIPDLYVSLMTTALGSREMNEQALGRTRKLKNYPETTPKFLYLVCEDIDKHVDYHNRKIEYFKDKVLSHQELMLPYKV